MKTLVVIALFFVATICSAQVPLDRNQDGKFRGSIEPSERWEKSEISADTLAMKYIDKFPQAISNPGERIPVERSERMLTPKALFKREAEVNECFILYNRQTNNIDYVETGPVKKEETSYLILFSVASILSMVMSNILFKKGYNGFVAAFAFAAAALAFAATVVALDTLASASAFTVAAAAALAFVVAAVAFAFTITAADKDYKVASIIFYILMATHIVLLFV